STLVVNILREKMNANHVTSSMSRFMETSGGSNIRSTVSSFSVDEIEVFKLDEKRGIPR
ncbi:16316_t:CDS:2, partial [Racocetra persica]